MTRFFEVVSILVGLALFAHGAWLISPMLIEMLIGILFIGAGVNSKKEGAKG